MVKMVKMVRMERGSGGRWRSGVEVEWRVGEGRSRTE
jgi:hypothetical protein